MRISLLFFAIISSAMIAACSSVGDRQDSLRQGMSKDEVLSLLGRPIEGEKYCREDVLFYYDGPKWFDGSITSDETFPLVFEKGKLVGWGQDFYQEHRKKSW